MSLTPRFPTDHKLTHSQNVSAGQKRIVALENAVSLALGNGGHTADDVVQTAEKFHTFLDAADDTDEPGEDG